MLSKENNISNRVMFVSSIYWLAVVRLVIKKIVTEIIFDWQFSYWVCIVEWFDSNQQSQANNVYRYKIFPINLRLYLQ